MQRNKIITVMAAVAMMLGQVSPVYAKLGSPGSGKASSSSSREVTVYKAPAAPAQARTQDRSYPSAAQSAQPSPAGRIGAGQSLGMQRADVTQRTKDRDRQLSPAFTPDARSAQQSGNSVGAALTPAPAPGAGLAPAQTQANRGPGWGTVAGAAAAAGVVGYLAGRDNNDHVVHSAPAPVQPGVAYDDGSRGYAQQAQPAPATSYGSYAPAQSGGSGWGMLIAAMIILGAGFYFVRRVMDSSSGQSGGFSSARASDTGPAGSFGASGLSSPKAILPAGALGITDVRPQWAQDLYDKANEQFEQIQAANNRGDLAFLSDKLGSDLYPEIKSLIEQRGGPDDASFHDVGADLEDATQEPGGRRLVSIRYRGTTVSHGVAEPLDEMWHYLQAPGQTAWKLNGIEQIA